MTDIQHQTITPADDNQIIAERRAKLSHLKTQGIAYPNDARPEHQAATIHLTYNVFDKTQLEAQAISVTVAGRIMLKRVMGKASFLTMQDGSGINNTDSRIQLYINDEGVGETQHETIKHWDLGDIIYAEGILFKTNKGELSIRCQQLRLLTKALRPLPDKFHGLTDREAKYRQRYVDLIVNPETRHLFTQRANAIQVIRDYMMTNAFVEVETPMLHPIPGGASAKPFVTHHNALDMNMFLRIAPELYLKRLIVGGFNRVFEINRNFRNEGVSPRHNPEFTMMEFYAAYTDYHWLMNFTEALLRNLAEKIVGRTQFEYQDMTLDFSKPFARLTIVDAILHYCPHYTAAQLNDIETLTAELQRLGVNTQSPALRHAGIGALQLALFEETTESQLHQPTFIIDYPTEVSPLSRESDHQPGITERFELFITGREIANGFSELNDPDVQAERFQAQVLQKDAGDDEAMYYDADYIRALEYGLPPTGGCGIGIDRVMMLLTNSANIRDVILFPHMRHVS